MFAEMDTPEWKSKFAQDHRFLRETVYAGLPELNAGFDSPDIGYFSPGDFVVIIDRCQLLWVRLIGYRPSLCREKIALRLKLFG